MSSSAEVKGGVTHSLTQLHFQDTKMYQVAEVEHMEGQKRREGNHETLFAQLHTDLESLLVVFMLHVMFRVPG